MGTMKLIGHYVTIYLCIFGFSLYYIIIMAMLRWRNRNKIKVNKDRIVEPSCLRDPALGVHGTVELKKRDGRVIHYVANGAKDNPLMLFLHGFPEFWYSWRHQLKEFGKDYYAVAMDLTGYGGSSIPTDINNYSTLELAMDVKETILELGFTSCVLVGHDWGGAVTYEVSTEFPEVVDKLIVMNCPNKGAFQKCIEGSVKQLFMSGYIFFFQIPYVPEYVLSANDFDALDRVFTSGPARYHMCQEDIDAYKYIFAIGGFTGPLNFYRNNIRPWKQRHTKRIVQPSLIIWGTEDHALSTQLAELTLKYCDDGRVKYVDGATHWVNMDEPKIVNEFVRDFLDGN